MSNIASFSTTNYPLLIDDDQTMLVNEQVYRRCMSSQFYIRSTVTTYSICILAFPLGLPPIQSPVLSGETVAFPLRLLCW